MGITTVLIVDDEPAVLTSMSKVLGTDYRVRIAKSGERALQVLANKPSPDLVLLDLQMPEMSGFEVLEQLKADTLTCDIPVIFVTATDDAASEERGLALGAADFVTKPINPPILLARVKAQLALKQARDFLQNKNAYLEAELERRIRVQDESNRQLLHSEKMASVGQLTAGVAHEINNPLGYVTTNINTLKDYSNDVFQFVDTCLSLEGADAEQLRGQIAAAYIKMDIDYLRQDIRAIFDESNEGLKRVRNIVENLKDFAHVDKGVMEPADLHQCLDSTILLVWNELKYHVELIKEYGELPLITCMPLQLSQVFMNLLVNASHAITEHGTITLRTGIEGANVWVEVADTGKGIEPSYLKRIFDPFFTTKEVGKGTGLGLSISYGIIEKHQGSIEVHSELGKGSCFRITIPVNPQSG